MQKEVSFGIIFPKDSRKKYYKKVIDINTEEKMKEAYEYIGKELFHVEFGYFLNIESENEIIGPDFAGKKIPFGK
ncbi:MAG: hypothetical protein ACUVQN_05175 [Caldisericia bacterium]